MPLDAQFRTVLDTFGAKGLVPLVAADVTVTEILDRLSQLLYG
jgi:hypothetical protein